LEARVMSDFAMPLHGYGQPLVVLCNGQEELRSFLSSFGPPAFAPVQHVCDNQIGHFERPTRREQKKGQTDARLGSFHSGIDVDAFITGPSSIRPTTTRRRCFFMWSAALPQYRLATVERYSYPEGGD